MNANRHDQLGYAAKAVISGDLSQLDYLSIAQALKFSIGRAMTVLNDMRTLRLVP